MRIDLKKSGPVLVFILFLAFLYANGFSRTDLSSDFSDYYEASRNFKQGKDLYSLDALSEVIQEFETGKLKIDQIFDPEVFFRIKTKVENVGSYIYPPTFAFLLIPISGLPFEVASRIFFTINFIALVLSLLLIGKLLGREKSFLFLSAVLLLSLRFVENHQNNNQVGFLLLFLILVSVSVQKDWLSGLILALAIVIKITPAAFLFYFLYKKRPMVIVYTIIFALGWIALPALYNSEFTWKMNQTWYDLVLDKYLKSPALRAWKNNQSLNSTLSKYFLAYSDLLNQARFGMPFTTLAVNQVKIISGILSLGIAGPYLYRVFKGASEGFVLSGLFFFSVIFSGISWIHAFVFLLFPTAFALSKLWPEQGEPLLVWEKWKSKLIEYRSATIFISISILVLLLNRSFIGNIAEEAILMFSFLLYTSLIQYVCTFYSDRTA
ncbi:glycosyltransferase family 87 protein [Leptospira dzoumogneensis]|uniref:DUF2029 domain-containing protein n=1 Tax=Leptospira dzoumogneensis TaxID=2484904 RepID=A0A4Z1ADA1_9LEPT|nr:glycosyltransferase family 87 protein [Leptospira dzoumogneensis]TGN00094.1 DUF2029 domain-containing protein [Leptospira dzoumogneensis]